MYELIQLSEHDYYMDCPARVGLVVTRDRDVVLIDSGSDKDAAKKMYRHIQNNNWNLTDIYLTHSHADHVGGGHFLQEKTGCRIWAKGLETAYANSPELEGISLYGGLPIPELKNKFLLAQPCICSLLTPAALPDGWQITNLPGHSFDMVGFRTADDNLFLGDCVASEETLQKYGISYLWDPQTALQTLEAVKAMTAVHFIPAHAPVTDDIASLAQINIDAIQAVFEKILILCGEPATFESILQKLFCCYHLTMNAQQYALTGSTLRGYLTNLSEQGKLTCSFTENLMLWKKTEA